MIRKTTNAVGITGRLSAGVFFPRNKIALADKQPVAPGDFLVDIRLTHVLFHLRQPSLGDLERILFPIVAVEQLQGQRAVPVLGA